MWKENVASLALLALAMVASICEVESFSNSLHVLTTAPRSMLSNPSSALSESFDDEDEYEPPKKKGFFANFFQELDAFVDDATSRRLGAGAQYYGKRKSSFYGKEDSNKKRDRVRPCLVWRIGETCLSLLTQCYSFGTLNNSCHLIV
jgi:hypothetical protein